jgi:hypothetical protein
MPFGIPVKTVEQPINSQPQSVMDGDFGAVAADFAQNFRGENAEGRGSCAADGCWSARVLPSVEACA